MYGNSDPRWDDPRDRDEDPRDVFLESLDLPRGLERELVLDRDHRYELNPEDTRTLAAAGAFRVIAERDLSDPRDESLRHLRDQGLIRSVSLDGRERSHVTVCFCRARRPPVDC